METFLEKGALERGVWGCVVVIDDDREWLYFVKVVDIALRKVIDVENYLESLVFV